MFRRKGIKINSVNVDTYKNNCYSLLDSILVSKKKQKNTIIYYSNKNNDVEEQLVNINDEIKKVSSMIRELNSKISKIEVEIYTCSYNYEILSKQRTCSFDEFKNDQISIEEHKSINVKIDNILKNYKQEYDDLCKEIELLKNKMIYYRNTYYKYIREKKELLEIKKDCKKNILIAKKNINICDYNIDSVNKTLEDIDILYFNDEEEVLEKKIQPKIKKLIIKE